MTNQKTTKVNGKNPDKGSSQDFLKQTGIGVIGSWLLLLYPLFTWLVIGTLSSYGFQDKVEQQGLTIPRVIRISEKLSILQDTETVLVGRTSQTTQKLQVENRKDNELKAAREILIELLQQHQDEVDSAEPPNFENEKFLSQYVSLLSDLPDVTRAWIQYETKLKIKQDLETELAALREELERVREQADVLSMEGRVDDLLGELDFMKMFGFKRMATMPDQLLTLLLTLSMGALGSLIYITRDYLDPGTTRSFSWYLFRPFLGMVTAVSVFVLAKAGQLTITDASISEGTSENLNPYFISFLAIISGLLSEQATEKIRATGSGFFRVEKPDAQAVERWAVGLKAHMEKQNKTVDDLASFVDEEPKTIEEWINETRRVPLEAQRIIAGCLAVPMRELFTDLSPPSSIAEKNDL